MKMFDVEMYDVKSKDGELSAGDTSGSFWRFMVFIDPNVTRYIIRDCDAKLSFRDASAVNEWVGDTSEPPLYFHLIRDHYLHSNEILGGMWGAIGGFLNPRSAALFASIPREQIAGGLITYGGDQAWLRSTLWPRINEFALAHDEFFCKEKPARDSRGFPFKREDRTDFVGNAYSPADSWTGIFPLRDRAPPPECLRNPSFNYMDWPQ